MKRLLALAMLFLPLGAKADDPVYNNGDTFTAETVEGVTMTFRVTDAENKVCSLAGSCIDKATTGMITIPESAQGYSVQSIGVQAFIYCTGITEISVPGSVKTIETGAFSGCSGLATVSLEEGVETLDYQCFRDCESLTAITLPNSLKNLNEGVFLGCTKLATVSFGNSLQSIGRHAFSRCTSLTSVVIPDNVITMGDAVFYHCTGLTSVTLPANLTSIEASMFCGCSNLVSVNIPAGVTTIGDAAFLNCNSLASVIFPNGLTSIGKNAFMECLGLTSISLPSSLTTVGENPFQSCENIKSAIISKNMASIPNGLFDCCVGLTSVTIPKGVTTIGDRAFAVTSLSSIRLPNTLTTLGVSALNCPNLTTVTIPASVTSIGDKCFDICRALKSVVVQWTTPINITSDVFLSDVYTGTLMVPYGTRDAYAAAEGWKEFQNIKEMPGVGNRDLTGQPYRYWFDRNEANMQTGTLESNSLVVDLPTDGLSDWYHILHLQTQDDAGNWSAVVSRSFAVVPVSTAGNRDLTGQPFRYWFDRDEANMKTGTLVSNNLAVDINMDGLSDWYHILHIQTQDDAGNWSPVISRSFAIVPASTAGSRDLTGQTYRYWFDRDEAGMKTGTLSGNNLVVDIPTDGLSDWYHILHIQTQDDAGNWSPVISRSFAIVPASTAGSRDLTGQPYQYWFDENFDVAVEGTMTGNVLQLDAAVEGLADGVHVFHLRTRDDKGNWSAIISRKFSVGGNYGDILPWGTEEAWTAKYQFQSLEDYQEPANDASGHTWTELDYDDSAWETLTGPMSDSAPADGYNYCWDGDQNCFNLRRRFTLDEVSVGRYQLLMHHDDGVRVWLNGQQVVDDESWGRDYTYEIPMSAFVVGENILAIYVEEQSGNQLLDYCLTCTPVSAFDLSVTASGNGTVSLVDTDVRGRTTTVQAKPKTDVTIAITPDRGIFIQSVMLDEEDVTNQLVDGKLTLPNLLANHTLVVTFISAYEFATVILPLGIEKAWNAKYQFYSYHNRNQANDAQGHTWTELNFDDSTWEELTGPMSNAAPDDGCNYLWEGDDNCFYLRRRFSLDEVAVGRYYLRLLHDDGAVIYLNGKQVAVTPSMDYAGDELYELPISAFNVGENLLAIYIEEHGGNQYLDYSLSVAPLGPSDYSFTDTQGLIYSLDYQNIMAMVSGHTNALPEDITIPTTLKVDNTTWPVFGFMPSALADASLSSVHVEETNPYAIPANAFSNETFAAAALMVPSTALDAYKRTAAWSGFDQIVPYTEGTLVPWGYEQPWTARYLFFEDASDYAEPEVDAEGHAWSDENFDDSAWQTLTGPMANNGQFPVVNHTAMGENSAWLLRRTFHVNRMPLGAIHLNVMHDDDIRTYVNGKEIDANSGTTVPRSLIHEGDNTIAFYYHVITPPDYIDYSFDYLGFIPQEGDANNDATIDLGDLVQIVSHITGTTPSHFNLSMADVNKDGEVNAADLVALVSLMMGEGTEIAPARLPSLQTEAADVLTGYVTADGRLCFDLQAETAYTACQLTLSLPAGADIKDVRLAAERSGGHVVTTGRREDGRVVVLVYSTANRPFLSQNGLFLEGVAQMANNGSIDVEDILFVTPKGAVRHFDSFSIDIAAGVASVKQEQHSDAPTYDLAGRRVGQSLKKGIYIQKGRKKLK